MSREQRRAWARAMIRRAWGVGTIPSYGDEAWCALPQDDPRRVAAVVVAAEAWAEDGDDVAARLRRELADADRAEAALEAEEDRRVAADVRALAVPRARHLLDPRGKTAAERKADEAEWVRTGRTERDGGAA